MAKSYLSLYREAKKAGELALKAVTPVPMIVGESKSLFGNDIDPSKRVYLVEGGVCGFASVRVTPGNCALANWLKKENIGRRSDYGGVLVSVWDGGQSLARKEAYGSAMAKVFRDAGFTAYCESRMD